MADLHKFIRQQFSDQNWARNPDISQISLEKLKEIAESFCHLDVRSKLIIILTYCNSDIPDDPEVAKYVESVVLQALDEENTFVRAIATILHSRQALGYLTFDISETNEAFAKTFDKLIEYQPVNISKIPLLAELLDDRVTTASIRADGVSPVPNHGPDALTRNCLNSNLGFSLRGKPPSLQIRETYLERLQEECERRRIHVPILGRNVSRKDDEDFENHHQSGTLLSKNDASMHLCKGEDTQLPQRRAPRFPRPTAPSRKADADIVPSSVPSELRSPLARSKDLRKQTLRPNGVLSAIRRPLTGSDRAACRLPAATQNRSSGIKILDFEELPAVGPKAKQLRKEQLEKEREQKRREREERIRERRELKGAARLNRLREQQEAELNKQAAAERLQHPNADDGTQRRPGPRPIFASPFSEPRQLTLAGVQDSTSPAPDADAKLNHPSHQQTTKQWTPLGFGTSNLLPHYATGALEDNEDEDDDDEDDLDTEGTDGTFALTLPPGFRGFNPVSTHVTTSTQGVVVVDASTHSQQNNAPQALTASAVQVTRPANQSSGDFAVQPAFVMQPISQIGNLIPRFVTSTTFASPMAVSPASSAHPQQQQPSQPLSSRVRFVRPQQLQGAGAASNNPALKPWSSQQDVVEGSGVIFSAAPSSVPGQPQQQRPIILQPQSVIPSEGFQQVYTIPSTAVAAGQQTPAFVGLQTVRSTEATLRPSAAPQGLPLPSRPVLQPQIFLRPNVVRPTATSQAGQPAVPSSVAVRLQPRLIQILPRTVTPLTSSAAPVVRLASLSEPQRPGLSSPTKNLVKIVPRTPVASPPASDNVSKVCIVPSAQCGNIAVPAARPSANSTDAVQQQQQQQILQPNPPAAVSQGEASADVLGSTSAGLKIQDDVRLTPAQGVLVQNLFQGANCLSKPEKAIIVSFVGGSRVNPHPEAGSALRIRLSEYRERVIDSATGNVMDVAADTFIYLNYATGKCEKIKCYRTLPAEMLMKLPANPAA
ncbi:hypothetical protein AAHC03_0920 [Spirometra sp. Aus1]